MAYRLIALDLDGTLLSSRKEISPRTREALKAARERGIVTVVATGRSPHSTLYWSRQIGSAPAISCNGAAILDTSGGMLVEKGIPSAPLQRLLQIGREARLLTECYTKAGIILDKPLEQMRAYLRWVRPSQGTARAFSSLARVWRINHITPVRSLLKWAEAPGHPSVLKLMVFGPRDDIRSLTARIALEMPGLELTFSAPDNLEVTAAGVSKGSALQQLSARLQVPREAIIAVGDSENDLEMLRYAGMGVAMANAGERVRAVADRTTSTCDEDGVARVIEELCLK